MPEWLMTLAEPLTFPFMVKALVVASLVGTVCAVLSCYLVLKGWSLMGDSVSHSILPGVALAYIVGLPMPLGAFVSGLGSALLTGFIKASSRIKEDTAMGVVFTGFFAVGLILVSVTPSEVHLMHILFGSLLGIPDREIIQTLVIGVLTLTLILIFRRDLILFIFDPVQAKAIGLNTRFLNTLFLSLLAAAIVASLQTAGVILVIAMLITPGATAYLLTDRFDRMTLIAVIISNLSAVFGTYLSFFLDGATGATIVCLQAVFFLITLFLAPRHGILAQRRAKLRMFKLKSS